MRRAAFLTASIAAALAGSAPARACDPESDPACASSSGPSLRVLLGKGRAEPVDAQTFLYDGRRYRGTYVVNAAGSVISTVGVDAYLYGVVPSEMPHSWPAEALRAQAIVARTYVLGRSNPRRDYDLVTSEYDQVYVGMSAERPESNAAVDSTAGRVLRYQNGYASVSYFSCCGGHTEAAAEAWGGGSNAPYTRGVPCSHCSDSPWYRWSHDISGDRFQAFAQNGDFGTLHSIDIGDRDPSGRTRFVILEGDAGQARVRAADFRRTLGGRDVPSLLFTSASVDASAQRVTLEGGGLGHGVGFCQWGARGLAKGGARADEIAAYYFPGTQGSDG